MVEPDPAPAVGETIEMRIAARRRLAEGVVELMLAPAAGGPAPGWEPGAHVDLHLPNGMLRQYSLCGRPSEVDGLRVAVLREADGRGGSIYLHDEAAEGDVIEVSGPRNHFALEPAAGYLFIAGGIGITPLVPMMAEAEEAGADWTLLYGGRSRRSMAFLAELEADPRVTIVPEDELGLLDLATALADPRPGTLIYTCGPEPLLAAIEGAATAWPQGALHLERFKPRDDVPDGPGTAFEVVLQRSGLTLTVESGRSILATVAAAGVAVPSSCEEGTCGTCETIVLAGEPEHRDSILSPAEQAANDCMMICCSRARGERLVLDL
ncbi:MAG: oxidoreductase [Actinobacteria bacterium]|nr:oxidoreductase [Actinomycetota bacterium]